MFDPTSFWGFALFFVVVVVCSVIVFFFFLLLFLDVVVSYMKEKDGKFMFKIEIKSLVYSSVLSRSRERATND